MQDYFAKATCMGNLDKCVCSTNHGLSFRFSLYNCLAWRRRLGSVDIDRLFWISWNHISQDAPWKPNSQLFLTSTLPSLMMLPAIGTENMPKPIKIWSRLPTYAFSVRSSHHAKICVRWKLMSNEKCSPVLWIPWRHLHTHTGIQDKCSFPLKDQTVSCDNKFNYFST